MEVLGPHLSDSQQVSSVVPRTAGSMSRIWRQGRNCTRRIGLCRSVCVPPKTAVTLAGRATAFVLLLGPAVPERKTRLWAPSKTAQRRCSAVPGALRWGIPRTMELTDFLKTELVSTYPVIDFFSLFSHGHILIHSGSSRNIVWIWSKSIEFNYYIICLHRFLVRESDQLLLMSARNLHIIVAKMWCRCEKAGV